MALWMFVAACAVLLLGYPVALSLAGVALWFAAVGVLGGWMDAGELLAMPNRLYGIMVNETLVAVPLFVLMGVILEKARLAEDLLDSMVEVFGSLRGGLGVAVVLVGALLAASTGIVGATVVTMGLLALPTMLKHGYSPSVASGTIAAAGTLGQIIPPSIVLVLLGDVLSSAYQQAQLAQGIFSTKTVSVGDLFVGALIPGLLLVAAYISYILLLAWWRPQVLPVPTEAPTGATSARVRRLLIGMVPPLALILAVLGSIMLGLATPTEAAAVGACGALLLAVLRRQLDWAQLLACGQQAARITSMVFLILIGASLFSLVFNAYQGDELVHALLTALPGGALGAMVCVMLLMFLLGFILDFIEITFVVVPIVGPILLQMGLDPVWLGVMLALNLQTSFLTPPFGFALFYLRGVAPPELSTPAIYRGVVPFIGIQLLLLLILALWPALATWLPHKIYG